MIVTFVSQCKELEGRWSQGAARAVPGPISRPTRPPLPPALGPRRDRGKCTAAAGALPSALRAAPAAAEGSACRRPPRQARLAPRAAARRRRVHAARPRARACASKGSRGRTLAGALALCACTRGPAGARDPRRGTRVLASVRVGAVDAGGCLAVHIQTYIARTYLLSD
jgi:hypothetical protein